MLGGPEVSSVRLRRENLAFRFVKVGASVQSGMSLVEVCTCYTCVKHVPRPLETLNPDELS